MAVAAQRTDYGGRVSAAAGGEAHAAVAIQRALRGSLGRRRASEERAKRALQGLRASQGGRASYVPHVGAWAAGTGADSDLERLLFKPSGGPSREGPGAEFLAGLIDSRLLIDAWKEMLRKQRSLERRVRDTTARLDELDACNVKERLRLQSRSLESFTEQMRSLERQLEARTAAQDLIAQRLGEQVEASRAAAEAAVAAAERQGACLAAVSERVDVQEQAACAARDGSRAEEEAALARHQDAVDLGRRAVEEVKGLEAKLSERLNTISSRLESTDGLTAQAVEETRSVAAYVRSEDFQKVVDGWSSDCFLRMLPEESTRIHAELLRPMQNDIHQKFAEATENIQGTKKAVSSVSNRLSLTSASLEERFARLRAQGATTASLGELQEQVSTRVHCCEAELAKFTESISAKVLDVTKWVSKLQVVFDAHEHALQHVSEEMHNRSSKFDMAMVDDRVSKCAVKDVVEEKLRSLKMLQEVQGTAIERIDVAFGKQADDMEQASDPGEQAVEPARSGSAARPRSAASSRTSSPRRGRSRGRASAGLDTATERCYQLGHQMEVLAQGMLALASLTIRSTGSGLPREARAECESQLVRHLACLLHWVTHRAAPAGWAPGQLTSLALRALRGEDAGDGGSAACGRRSGSPGRDAPASPDAATGRVGGAQELRVQLAPLTPMVVDAAGRCSVPEAAGASPGAACARPPSRSSPVGPGGDQPRSAAPAVRGAGQPRPATAEPAARARLREEPSLEVSAGAPRPRTAGEAPMPAFPAPGKRRAPRSAQPKAGGAQAETRLPSAVARTLACRSEPSAPLEDPLTARRQSGPPSSRPESRAGGWRAYVVTPDVAAFSAEGAVPAPRR